MKVDGDLENIKFNTAVAAVMEFTNWWADHREETGKEEILTFIKIMAPMAPFWAEELWQQLTGGSDKQKSVHEQEWPKIDPGQASTVQVTVVIQVDGKFRDKLEIDSLKAGEQEYVTKMALVRPNIVKYTGGKKYRVVNVPGKVVNIVTE